MLYRFQEVGAPANCSCTVIYTAHQEIQADTDRCTQKRGVQPSLRPKFALSFRVWCTLRLHRASLLFHLRQAYTLILTLLLFSFHRPFLLSTTLLLSCSPLRSRLNEVIVFVCFSHKLLQPRSHPVLVSDRAMSELCVWPDSQNTQCSGWLEQQSVL